MASVKNVINLEKSPKSELPKLGVINVGEPGSLNLSQKKSGEPGSLNLSQKKSVNFGPGLELLMNPKKSISSPKSDIKLDDLKSLDAEVNKLETLKVKSLPTLTPLTPSTSPNVSLNIQDKVPLLNLGKKITPDKKTWDGYTKFNNIPVDPTKKIAEKPKMSTDDITRQKLFYIRKLNLLEKRGIKLTKTYTMDDPLAAIKGEWDMLKQDKEKQNSVKFQGKMLMAFISGLEFLNNKFDPFDLKLDGWAEAVNENIEDYDDVFEELHLKYGEKTKLAPELKLLFMVGGSAAMLHMTNTMFKSAMPGMDDIMRQNPELMSQFTQAAANTMSRETPGFGNFMRTVAKDSPPGAPPGPSEKMKREPPPFEPVKRKEMKGPKDLKNILSGLKTKKVKMNNDSASVASVEEIKELASKHKGRTNKNRSDKNIVSLNI